MENELHINHNQVLLADDKSGPHHNKPTMIKCFAMTQSSWFINQALGRFVDPRLFFHTVKDSPVTFNAEDLSNVISCQSPWLGGVIRFIGSSLIARGGLEFICILLQ